MRLKGVVLLAVFLFVLGVSAFTNLPQPITGQLTAVLAIAAAVLMVLDQKVGRLFKNIGLLLLCIWLVLYGLLTLFAVGVSAVALGMLALGAGLVLLTGLGRKPLGKPGMLLLALFLIVYGAFQIITIPVLGPLPGIVQGMLALAAGIVLLLERR